MSRNPLAAVGRGYASAAYAATLGHLGEVVTLPVSGAHLLRRSIPGGGVDLSGPYPLLIVPRPAGLAADLQAQAATGAVSVTAVLDPLTTPDDESLASAFPDLLTPFKHHHLVDLTDAAHQPTAHHRRDTRRALRRLRIERTRDADRATAALVRCYGALRQRVAMDGPADLPDDALAAQIRLDDVTTWVASADSRDVGVALFVTDGERAWYHLAAADDEGRRAGALYGLLATALDEQRDSGIAVVDLGGPAGSEAGGDGLDAFKAGWATHRVTARLAGAVLDRDDYDRRSGPRSTSWFPAYRDPARPAPSLDPPVRTGTPNEIDRTALFALIGDALDRRRLTNDGPFVRELEERLAERCGAHVVAVANGTMALTVAGQALGLRGRIAVPSWTFAGTVSAIVSLGATPVFVDVGADHVMDPAELARVAADGLDGVVPVHLFGRACDTDALGVVAGGLGVPVLYDAAQALGTTRLGVPVGALGTAATFSLHATKWFSTVEGGLITTTDAALADECRRLRFFGFDHRGRVAGVGTNAKMSELHAAVGLTQLDRYDGLRSANEERYGAYRAALADVPGVHLVDTGPDGTTARPYVVVEVDGPLLGHRDRLWRSLAAEGVHTRRYFHPGVHRLGPYRTHAAGAHLPVTERLAATSLSLPTGDAVTVETAARIGVLVGRLVGGTAPARRELVAG